MSKDKTALPGQARQEQGEQTSNNKYVVCDNILFDMLDSIPGCMGDYGEPGEYKGIDVCVACEYRLPCARMHARERL